MRIDDDSSDELDGILDLTHFPTLPKNIVDEVY